MRLAGRLSTRFLASAIALVIAGTVVRGEAAVRALRDRQQPDVLRQIRVRAVLPVEFGSTLERVRLLAKLLAHCRRARRSDVNHSHQRFVRG